MNKALLFTVFLAVLSTTAGGSAKDVMSEPAGDGLAHAVGPAKHLLRCPAGGDLFARTELFFGLSRNAGPDITEAEFSAFLDSEVTPRFPDGLTVLDARGQFRGASGVPVKEGSKLLILLHGGSNSESASIEAIREQYILLFQQESVLRTDETDCVSF
jgi:Protein of unknown function (DUF3574)